MDTIDQIRLKNLNYLISREGSLKAFCDKSDKPAAQISQLRGKNPTRGVGDKLAREFEVTFGLEHGWMDHSNPDPTESVNSILKLVQDSIDTLCLSEHEAELLRIFRSLDEIQQSNLMGICRQLRTE